MTPRTPSPKKKHDTIDISDDEEAAVPSTPLKKLKIVESSSSSKASSAQASSSQASDKKPREIKRFTKEDETVVLDAIKDFLLDKDRKTELNKKIQILFSDRANNSVSSLVDRVIKATKID